MQETTPPSRRAEPSPSSMREAYVKQRFPRSAPPNITGVLYPSHLDGARVRRRRLAWVKERIAYLTEGEAKHVQFMSRHERRAFVAARNRRTHRKGA